MRTTTQICERALCIGCDRTVFQFTDQLSFIFFTSVTEHFHGISLGNVLTFDFFFFSYQFQHLCFDCCEITFFDCSFTRIYVIVESILDSRTDTELDARIKFLQCFSHQVST